MIDGKKVLGIIPARGGSKRLPGKNIKPLHGKPLISWTIEAAKKSKYIDEVVVSSDDDRILDIARSHGIVALKRPNFLATDTASTIEVVKHVLDTYREYVYIVLLQPTSPLRNYKHIDEAIEYLMHKEADAVISVCPMEHTPLWSSILPEDNNMADFISKEIKNKRSQDLPTYYRLNGAIYICKKDRLLNENTIFLASNIYAYRMDRKDSIDIDEEMDFILAEHLIIKMGYI